MLKDLFREYTRRGHTIMMSHAHARSRARRCATASRSSSAARSARCGTMDELRAHAERRRRTGLEEIFLAPHGRERGARPGRRARCLSVAQRVRGRLSRGIARGRSVVRRARQLAAGGCRAAATLRCTAPSGSRARARARGAERGAHRCWRAHCRARCFWAFIFGVLYRLLHLLPRRRRRSGRCSPASCSA